ncbi:MAG: hypothetical protein IPG33_09745 [Betaproteobacteria bacterium]|nr:hypothetical protein [Betaproteobacteria bacterium]
MSIASIFAALCRSTRMNRAIEPSLIQSKAPASDGAESLDEDRKGRRLRLQWLAVTALSYGVDTLFLGLFAAVGTLRRGVPAGYAAAAALACGFSFLALAGSWHRRFNNNFLSTSEMVAGAVIQCAAAYAAPPIAFLLLANLFTVLAFGVFQLTLRQFVFVWGVSAVGAGLVLLGEGTNASMLDLGRYERILACLYEAKRGGRDRVVA